MFFSRILNSVFFFYFLFRWVSWFNHFILLKLFYCLITFIGDGYKAWYRMFKLDNPACFKLENCIIELIGMVWYGSVFLFQNTRTGAEWFQCSINYRATSHILMHSVVQFGRGFVNFLSSVNVWRSFLDSDPVHMFGTPYNSVPYILDPLVDRWVCICLFLILISSLKFWPSD